MKLKKIKVVVSGNRATLLIYIDGAVTQGLTATPDRTEVFPGFMEDYLKRRCLSERLIGFMWRSYSTPAQTITYAFLGDEDDWVREIKNYIEKQES